MDLNNVFSLMNKDKRILSFESIKGEFGEVQFRILEQLNESPLPKAYEDLYTWIEKRQAPKHREHIADLLRICGCYELDGFIRVSHALSLNDTFWIRPENKNITWENVSLYTNPFNEVIARIAFDGGLYGEQFSSTSPELGTDGAHAKCWIREKEDIYLLKRGTTGARNAGLEPYSEFYSSQISKIICKKSVPYNLVIHHKKLASKCPLFTNEQEGFVPMWKLFNKHATPRDLLAFFTSIGDEDSFRRMLVFDALTLNTDRHMGNYGVLVDNDTQEILSMAPVFDNNQALLPYAEEKDFQKMDEYLASRPTRIGVDFNEIANWALTPAIKKDLINLKGFAFTRHEKYNLSDERLKVLETVVERQIENILKDIHLYVPLELKKEEQPKFKIEQKAKENVYEEGERILDLEKE